jgi:hypothetical protein
MNTVENMAEIKNAYRILVGNPKGRDHLEGLGAEWRIILKWVLQK